MGQSPRHSPMERVFGRHSVQAALTSRLRNCYKLSVYHDSGVRRMTAEQMQVQKLIELAKGVVPVEFVSKALLDKWSEGRPHQNVVLSAGPLPIPSARQIEDIPSLAGTNRLVLALDALMDPQNIGAIIRSAYFLGATAVLLHRIDLKRSSQTVSRASAGVLEAWNRVYSTDKLDQFLGASKSLNIAASIHQAGKKDLPISEYGKHSGRDKVLVIGSEHDGVSKRVLEQCQYVTSIPSPRTDLLGQYCLDSMNVSAATAILLQRLIVPKK